MLNSTFVILFFFIPVGAGPIHDVVHRASPAVVKLYGAGAGREHGYGTGVLVSSDGKIVTTLSLLAAGSSVRVVLADGRRFDGRLLRTDESRQLALLKIDVEDLPFLDPAPSDGVRTGDAILGLSNYFKIAEGDEPVSVCRGVVSGRLAALSARRLAQEFEYTGPAVVYDAITANPGAAGGPVLDADGRFIGLIGKIVEASATNTRLNYAIPGEVLADFLGERPSPREPTRTAAQSSDSSGKPYVGIRLSAMGFRHVAAYVERVRPGSPAAKAGIRPDDLIVGIDGRRVGDAASCVAAIEALLPGQTVQFNIKRGEQLLAIPVVVEELPATEETK
jgi:serine protease Do